MTLKKPIVFKFKKWERHQVRKDYKRPHWFALSNDFSIDPKLGDLTNEEKLCLVYLLCEASRQNKRGNFEIFTDHWCRVQNISSGMLFQTLEKLEKLDVLYRICTESERYITPQNITPQNITPQNRTEQNTTEQNKKQSSSGNLSISFASDEPLKKNAPKILIFPEPFDELSSLWLARGVKPKQLEAMLLAFPDAAWILGEAKRASAWEAANPQRAKKDFARFLNNWLGRAWDARKSKMTQNGPSDLERREFLNREAARAVLERIGEDHEKTDR